MNHVLTLIDQLFAAQDERNRVVFEMAERARETQPEKDRFAGKEVS